MHATPARTHLLFGTSALILLSSILAGLAPIVAAAPPDDVGCGKARAALRTFANATYDPPTPYLFDQSADSDMLHNKIELEVFPATDTLTGSNEMTVRAKTDGLTTFTFRLHESFTITSAVINGETPVSVSGVDFLTRVADLDRPYAIDEEFTLKIAYTGQPVSMGFGSIEFRRQNGFGPDIVYSLSEPYYAATWWPCKDGGFAEPADNADKATLELSVVAPQGMTTVSNGLLQGIDDLTENRRRFRYRSDYPISTYLVCFSATEYNTWTETYDYTGGTMPVDFYVYPMDDTSQNRAAWNKVLDMLPVFAERFGEYPFVNEKYGIYECEFGGGMEHQTMTAQGTFSERVTAHELAHQWWGDMVTCRHWNDIWLNEGFATYSEALWEEFQPGSPGLPALIQAMDDRRPFTVNGSVYVYDDDLDDIGRIFSGSLSYRKGGWVLHQLRNVVGDDTFWDILAAYREQYEFSAATTDDFAAVCAQVYGQDLSWFFDEWVYDIGAPEYDWGWQAVNILDQDYVRLYVNQTQSGNYPRFTMPIDIEINGTQTHVIWNDADTEHFIFPVDAAATSVAFDPDAWILWTDRDQVAYVPGPPAVVQTAPHPGEVLIAPRTPLSVFVTFGTDVAAGADDFSIVGDIHGPQSFNFSYNAADFTARLDLDAMAPPDRYVVSVSDDINALDSGDSLDGEIADPEDSASLPSGDGLPGGDAILAFFVEGFPGDADGDGDVDLFDCQAYFNCVTGPGGSAGPECTAFDFDEDQDIDFVDFDAFQRAFTGGI